MRYFINGIMLSFSIMFCTTFVMAEQKRSNLPQITGLTTTKVNIKFYKDPNSGTVDFILPANSLQFPMTVLDEQGDYVKVANNGQLAWLRSSNFKLSRSCSELAAQSQADKNSRELSASRGAGNGNGCSK